MFILSRRQKQEEFLLGEDRKNILDAQMLLPMNYDVPGKELGKRSINTRGIKIQIMC